MAEKTTRKQVETVATFCALSTLRAELDGWLKREGKNAERARGMQKVAPKEVGIVMAAYAATTRENVLGAFVSTLDEMLQDPTTEISQTLARHAAAPEDGVAGAKPAQGEDAA